MLNDEGTSPSSVSELQCDVAEKCCESFHRGRPTLALVTPLDRGMNVDTQPEDVGAFLQRCEMVSDALLAWPPPARTMVCLHTVGFIKIILISCSFFFDSLMKTRLKPIFTVILYSTLLFLFLLLPGRPKDIWDHHLIHLKEITAPLRIINI